MAPRGSASSRKTTPAKPAAASKTRGKAVSPGKVAGSRAAAAKATKASTAKAAAAKGKAPSRQTRRSKVKSSEMVDDEASDASETSDSPPADGEETTEERLGISLSDDDYEMADAEAEDSGPEDLEVEEVPATPRINRRNKHPEVKTEPSPGSPSPAKKPGARTQKTPKKADTPVKKAVSQVRKTPGKRAKQDISDHETDEEQVSPMKKTRMQVDDVNEDADEDVVIVEQPRGRKQTRGIQDKASKEGPSATGGCGRAAAKASAATGAGKAKTKPMPTPRKPVRAPDSGDRLFNPNESDVDDATYRAQTALFRKNMSPADDFDDIREALDEINGKAKLRYQTPEAQTAKSDHNSSGHSENDAMKLESSPSLEYPGDDEGHKLQALGSPYSGAPADGRSLGDIIQNGVVVPPGLSLIVDPYNEEVCDAALQTDYFTLPPLKPHEPDYGSQVSQLATCQLGPSICFQKKYNISTIDMIRLAQKSHDPRDEPFIINPARESPNLVTAHYFPGAKNPVLAMRKPSGYERVICTALGQVLDCRIVTPATLANRDKPIKQLVLAPLSGEIDRALAFYGHVFGHSSLGVSTWWVGQSERIHGISFRTMPPFNNDNVNVQPLPGMRFKKNAQGHAGKGPGSSFVVMRDKTVWSTDDDIPIWDGRKFFQRDKKLGEDMFCHDVVPSLPRFPYDLAYGDVALAYYSVSTYPITSSGSNSSFTKAAHGLSFNLYGVLLVASLNY
ncbi:hypothetical protein C8Q76DRAFT_801993 [Earliella scabrosa]|nr:hypothetical protein C8Q76DRAFT_801993 [Earliella scabrosa]